MKVLLASEQPFLPQVAGGAQSSTHEIALELMQHQVDVSLLAGLGGGDWLGWRGRVVMRLTRKPFARDHRLGYPAYRAWFPHSVAAKLAAELQPDVAVVPTSRGVPLGRSFLEAGIPIVVYLRDVEFHELAGSLSELSGAVYVANSEFTASRYRQAFDIEVAVIPPLFQAERYRTRRIGRYVTFINPHPKKGLDIAVQLARTCTDIPFLFVAGWALSKDEQKVLDAQLTGLQNVTLAPRAIDMRPIYAKTQVLLAPSRWAEAWGRVASEAHYSGIPVIASRIGGLPESVGPGGVLIKPDAPIEQWVQALRQLWSEPECYARLSAAAQNFSERPALNRKRQIESLMKLLEKARRSGSNNSTDRTG